MAAALVRGAAAYGEDREMTAWAQAQGCEGCEVFRDDRSDTLGFAAAGEERVFVVFRGTRDLRNWISDLDCRRVNVTPVLRGGGEIENCKLKIANLQLPIEVHEGFWGALEAVWEELADILDNLARGRAEVFFAGHSLGGALAMLACARWESQKAKGKMQKSEESGSVFSLQPLAFSPSSWLYTFGQPRVGNGAWAAWYDACSVEPPAQQDRARGSTLHDRSFRVVHGEDVVPRVPWLLNWYRHAGTEIFYDALGGEHVDWPWWRKAPGDVFGSLAEWTRNGRVALVGDHGVGTYVEMLKG
jgi:triacylglycerol lipase